MRIGACSTDKSIDSKPSRDGSSAKAFTSSKVAKFPSIKPALISKASFSLAKLLIIRAGATTSSLENAIALGPVSTSLSSAWPTCSVARRTKVFLYTFNSTPASRNCLRNSVT